MDRRSALERALYLLGGLGAASMVLGSCADTRVAARSTLAPSALGVLSAVADTILPKTSTPGAIDAQVPSKLTLMLQTWASPERHAGIILELGRIDQMALATTGMPFEKLTPAMRKELLGPYDSDALKQNPQNGAKTGMSATMGPDSVMNADYHRLKELIVILYYISEEALTTELDYEHTPGGWTASIAVTPSSRKTGGL